VENAVGQPRERLRQVLAHLGRLGTTEKLLVACVAVIIGLSFYLVAQYAATPSTVPAVTIADPANRGRALSFLRANGLSATSSPAGEVLVPEGQAAMARAWLQESQVVPMDTKTLYERLADSRSWMNSRQQNHQQYWAIYAQALSEDLSLWRSLKRAVVRLDVPEPGGLGRAHRTRHASVTVFPAQGELPQQTVDAIARAVINSVSGLEPGNITIVDGLSGLSYQPSDGDGVSARAAMRQRAGVEEQIERKIREFLRDIPGLSLSVLARLDNARRTQQSQQYDKPVSGLATESRAETTQQSTTRGGAPGTRSNESMSITQGSAEGTRMDETTEDTAFEMRFPSVVEQSEDPGGDLESVSVLLGVPRSHVARLIELERAPAPEGEQPQPPTPQEITTRFEAVRADLEQRIRSALSVIVTGQPEDVAVSVSMLADAGGGPGSVTLGGLGVGGAGAGGGGILGALGGGLVDRVVLGVLALVSVGLMLMLVRRATRKADLPTAEEIVGIPQALQADGDVFGEADEGDVPMSGIELDDERVRTNKILEQVGDLVQSSPEVAGQLLQSWVSADEP